MRKINTKVISMFFTIFCVAIILSTKVKISADSQLQVLTNNNLMVKLCFLKGWTLIRAKHQNTDEILSEYKGKDGYLKIGSRIGAYEVSSLGECSIADNIDDVVKEEAKQNNIDGKIAISKLKVDGQDARLITSSASSNSQIINSELLVRYPNEITLMAGAYQKYYFVLIADKKHILDISKSIKFTRPSNNLAVYISNDLHVSLNYNKNWLHPYDGTGGRKNDSDEFFQINALAGRGKKLDDLIQEPFSFNSAIMGLTPKVSSLKINYQDARLKMASNDGQNIAVLIVKYPKNCIINGADNASGRNDPFDYFTLTADKKNIFTIAKTIKFIP